MARLLPCLKAAEPGVDMMGGMTDMDGVGAIGAGGEFTETGLMAGGVIMTGGLAIGDGVIVIGGGDITRGNGAMVVEGDIAGAWPEDKTASISDKVSVSTASESVMTFSVCP
ncbi:hypothetical protein POM88_033659 [Heracleum sosnowskyi]|uniref:Uncharacterized protein n=1 Tax=Heracleum sosnowskyi TaxID=360622 RepID=A0AAD8HHT1_9APIA|nr:hypothetical protein POM88_033659 [Heracleum sosnowskyi]